MQNFSNWFSRCTGDWVSHRRYLTLPARKDDSYKTEFTVKADGNNVSISWDGEASAGTMNMTIVDDMLKRDIGYLAKTLPIVVWSKSMMTLLYSTVSTVMSSGRDSLTG